MFLLSKLLSAITQPLFWVALVWLTGLLLLKAKPRLASRWLWLGLLSLGLLGIQAIPDALLRPLENRYTIPASSTIPEHAGLMVLGGALEHPSSYLAHGQVPMGDAAERMTLPVGLMRQHPNLKLIFSGGEGRVLSTGVSESELARAFYAEQGLPAGRLAFEDTSRNTRENALFTARLLAGQCPKPWLLVTSAWHMPRAMAEFEPELRRVGCRITPYPVDFRTGESTPLTEYSLAKSLLRWQIALHEWLGLLVYGVTRG